MKKALVLLSAIMLLTLAACGGSEDTALSTPTPDPVVTRAPDPTPDVTEAPITDITHTANGITYVLDSTMQCITTDESSTQQVYTSDTIWITVRINNNKQKLATSEELANYYTSPGNSIVGNVDDVYYLEYSNPQSIVAYYVNDSGNYWTIKGHCANVNHDMNLYKEQIIKFCTSGTINE